MRRALGLVVIALAMVALGCASGDPGVEAGAASSTTAAVGGGLGAELGRIEPEATGAFVGQAAQRTMAAETGTFLVSMVVDEGGPNEFAIMVVEGTYDRDRGVSRTMIDISGLAERAPHALTDDPDEEAIMTLVFRDPLDIIEDADTTYLRADRLISLLQSPTDWVTMPLDADDSFGGIASAFQVDDLAEFLAELEDAGEVEELGTEDLDGTEVWHYRVVIGDGAGAPGGLFGGISGDRGENGTVEVWVDDRAVIHRMTAVGTPAVVLPALGPDFGGTDLADIDFGSGDLTILIELSDIGESAQIDVPAGEDATPIDDLDP